MNWHPTCNPEGMRTWTFLLVVAAVAVPATSRADGPPAPAPQPAPAASGYYAPPPYYPPPGYYPPPPGGYWMPGPPPEEAGTKRRSTGMMVTGIVFASLGAANAIAGAVMMAAAPKRCMVAEADFGGGGSFNDGCEPDPGFIVVGGVTMAAGGALLAIGIPLWIVGARTPSPNPPERSAARPTLLVGPRSAGVRFAF